MTLKEQLDKWVGGESIHNEERNECCPDFSCCRPQLQASLDDREIYARAYEEGDEKTCDLLLLKFLDRMLNDYGYKVVVG